MNGIPSQRSPLGITKDETSFSFASPISSAPTMPSEERVMRAREVLAAAFAKLPHGRARAESFRTPAFTTDDDRVILAAMVAFADEGSGIGEWACVKALDEAAAQCTRVGVETTFASEVSDEFRRGHKAGADFCQMAIHLMAKERARNIPLATSPDIDRSGLAQEVE